MAYIEKEPIIEFITKGLNNPDKSKAYGYDAVEILAEIEYTPIADVVPSSEIESLQAQIAQLQLDLHYSVCREDVAVARTAKEIFEDIEQLFIDGCETYYTMEIEDFVELKNKYTGEK